MKFCSFSVSGQKRFGCEYSPGSVVDLVETGRFLLEQGAVDSSVAPFLGCRDLKDWFSHGKIGVRVAREICQKLRQLESASSLGVYPSDSVNLLAPIARPGKIIAIGLNYLDHAEEQKAKLPECPLIFAKFPTAVIGPGEPIVLPSISSRVDPEVELCAVLVEGGRGIKATEARDKLGFMVGIDVSARDLQYSDKQWVRGKSLDTFAPCGPFVVTPDELGEPHALGIELRVNGNVQQSSNTNNLIFDTYKLVEFISEAITLEPGDIIFTGTPAGVGVFRDPPVFLKPGDVVEARIEKLGVLKHPVVAA